MMNFDDTFVREFEIDENNVLKIHQVNVGDVGCVVWDAALVLSKYLIKMSDNREKQTKLNIKGSQVIELGAGTGLVGLTAAVLGADVILTDLEEFLPLLLKNIDFNKEVLKGSVTALSLPWGRMDQINSNLKNKNFIFVSDCIYYKESLQPLVTTLESLSDEKTIILFCYEERHSNAKQELEHKFFEMINNVFDIVSVSEEELHEDYRSSDIHVLKFIKRLK